MTDSTTIRRVGETEALPTPRDRFRYVTRRVHIVGDRWGGENEKVPGRYVDNTTGAEIFLTDGDPGRSQSLEEEKGKGPGGGFRGRP